MKEHKQCARCIMDTSAPEISFDENGYCNYCTDYLNLLENPDFCDHSRREKILKETVEKIQKESGKKEYDCVLGVSGGLDSSFLLYKAIKLGLRPLAVHLDNGWNSELSVNNIENLVRGLNVDLYTHVIDWEEFRDLQIAFFKSNVIDIELLTDHAIGATLYEAAARNKVKYILAGSNIANEGMVMPPGWIHMKLDLKNIKAIYKRFGSGRKLETFPTISMLKHIRYSNIDKIEWVPILNYLHFHRDDAIETLSREVGWKPYEKKHYESVFTRFYQACILPEKFKVDKRLNHFSNLICSGQMTRKQALEEMKKDPYGDLNLRKEDKKYVLKKLNFSEKEFEEYLKAPPVPHSQYSSNVKNYRLFIKFVQFVSDHILKRNSFLYKT